jgi:hypothetical protein
MDSQTAVGAKAGVYGLQPEAVIFLPADDGWVGKSD